MSAEFVKGTKLLTCNDHEFGMVFQIDHDGTILATLGGKKIKKITTIKNLALAFGYALATFSKLNDARTESMIKRLGVEIAGEYQANIATPVVPEKEKPAKKITKKK